MPNTHSQRLIAFVFAGRQISGLANVDTPIEIPNVPLYEAVWGYDSGLLLNDMSQRGGMVNLKLQPTSPDVAFFSLMWNLWSNGALNEFQNGLYSDRGLGTSIQCLGGAVMDMPIVPQFRKNYEVQIVFERFVINAAASTAVAPPPTALAGVTPFSGPRSPLGL